MQALGRPRAASLEVRVCSQEYQKKQKQKQNKTAGFLESTDKININ